MRRVRGGGKAEGIGERWGNEVKFCFNNLSKLKGERADGGRAKEGGGGVEG